MPQKRTTPLVTDMTWDLELQCVEPVMTLEPPSPALDRPPAHRIAFS